MCVFVPFFISFFVSTRFFILKVLAALLKQTNTSEGEKLS